MRLTLDPIRLLLISLAGCLSQQQQDVIDYLQEENRVLREQLGNKRLRLNDGQRRRLACQGKETGACASRTGHRWGTNLFHQDGIYKRL